MQDRNYEIEFLPNTKRELKDIYCKHLELVGANSADSIIAKIEHSVSFLSSSPYMGAAARNKKLSKLGYRYIISEVYLIFYKVEDKVNIYHIVDGRTNYLHRVEW